MVIGIDHGNSQIKTMHTTFTSGITEHGSAKPPLPTDIVFYDGNYYTISNKRETYKRDKTQDEKCFIMTLFALAKEILATNQYKEDVIDVDLAIGLPPEHYAKQRNIFSEYFLQHGRTWTFTYNDKKFIISINDVHVFPQAYSAIATRASILKEYSSTYIIDIGGYTVDVLLLSEGRPDLQYCHSLELGIIQMNINICNRVNSEYALKIDDNHVMDVLLGRKTTLSDEIKAFIKQSAKAHAYHILNTLRESSVDLRANPAIFIGGGSMILKDLILSTDLVEEEYTEFIPEVTANAAGYTALATGLIRQKKMQNANG